MTTQEAVLPHLLFRCLAILDLNDEIEEGIRIGHALRCLWNVAFERTSDVQFGLVSNNLTKWTVDASRCTLFAPLTINFSVWLHFLHHANVPHPQLHRLCARPS